MGAMKDYAIWLEENGHTHWNEETDQYEFESSDVIFTDIELWQMYTKDRENTRTNKEQTNV